MNIAVEVLAGAILGSGLILAAAPWLWPASARRRRASRTTDLLHRAGYHRARPHRVALVAALLSVSVALLLFGLTGVPAIAGVAAVGGAALPVLWLSARARRRRRQRESLWPDVIDHLVAALRSGQALPDAVSSLAETGPAALAEDVGEFTRVLSQSGSWERALVALQDRLADPVADQLCETLRVARDLGGTNLIPVLIACADFLRQHQAVQAEIRARQSWITNAAWLGIAAPWVVLVLLNARGESRSAFTTPSGTLVIVGGAIVSVVAAAVMRRIGRFAPEPRWVRR